MIARPYGHRGRIVAATNLSDAASVAVAAAAEQSRLSGARLTLMCSIHERLETIMAMTSFGTTESFVPDEVAEVRGGAERELAALLERAGLAGDTVVADAEPAAELVHLAGQLGAELAVVGAIGRTALRRLQLGKVAERAIRHAPCSVLVARVPPKVAR